MPLLSDHLSVWEIGFRWAWLNPYANYFTLPLAARDNFRLMIDSIWQGELECDTLSTRKWKEGDGEEMRPFFMRHHWAKIEDCITGKSPDRKLLKWAVIGRGEMEAWCKGRGIPLPEFWFPAGWKSSFEWPNYDEPEPDSDGSHPKEPNAQAKTRIACQEIAKAIWREQPSTTIADMIKNPHVQRLGGAAHFTEEPVRRWLSAVAPGEVKGKPGRPRKKTPRSDD